MEEERCTQEVKVSPHTTNLPSSTRHKKQANINRSRDRSTMSTAIFYHIPSDLDDEQHPNVFYVEKSSDGGRQLSLKEVRHFFPLPGQYHFRFKTNFKKTFVWKDVTSDSDKVPSHDGKFVAKVSRLRSSTDSFTSSSTSRAASSQSSSSSSKSSSSNSNSSEAE